MKRAGKTRQMQFGPTACEPPRSAPFHSGDPLDCRAVVCRLRPRRPCAQPPKPFIPDITERSGLLMRFASSPEMLPPDPHRDFFYNTRYADNGRVKHPNWVCTQGLYGLGWKTPDTKSVYPYFYGVPGQSTIDSSSRPWFRPARFFQGLAHPFRPVGSYYALGSYVPIYDLDPIAPGPGPYPYPVLLQLAARRLS